MMGVQSHWSSVVWTARATILGADISFALMDVSGRSSRTCPMTDREQFLDELQVSLRATFHDRARYREQRAPA
jgi:hypothetical protein